MIYVISDCHFGHFNIINYCSRPFSSVEEMNQTMIDNWNKVVSDEDTIIMLGDFCLGHKEEIIRLCSLLKGHKVLIKGNHDHQTNAFYERAGFEDVFKEKVILYLPDYDKTICFSHHPNYETKLLNIYGHVHDKPCDDENHKCACVELWNYEPVPIEKFIG